MKPRRAARLGRAVGVVSLLALGVSAQDSQAPQDGDSSSATRVSVEKSRGKTRVVVEAETTLTIDIAPPPTKTCAATIEVEYQQRDTVARATGIIDNPQCGASHGEYELAVTFRDSRGNTETREYSETWRREDDGPVTLAHEYPIGANVDLIRVRPRRLRCTCDDAPVAAAEE